MAAPTMMMVQQVPEGQQQQTMFVPMMVPCGYVAAPEFCGGMWVPPLGGYEAVQPHGGYRGPNPSWQGRSNNGRRGSREVAPWSQEAYGYAGSGQIMPQQEQAPEVPVVVELSKLPKMLCSKACLEAALEQAGLEKDVQSFEIETGTSGQATLTLASERAAQRCIRHFHGLQWAKSSEPVSACCRDEMAAEMAVPEQQQQEPAAPVVKAKPAVYRLPAEPAMPKRRTSFSSASPKLSFASPKSTCCSSPALSALSPSMKPRWADLDDDDSGDESSTKSTRDGSFALEPQSASDNGDSSNTEEQ